MSGISIINHYFLYPSYCTQNFNSGQLLQEKNSACLLPLTFDLTRLREFIAQHNPEAARRVAQRLNGAITRLVDMPQIGRPVSNIPGEIRELIFGKYVVRYEVRQDDLYILRIWHGKESQP